MGMMRVCWMVYLRMNWWGCLRFNRRVRRRRRWRTRMRQRGRCRVICFGWIRIGVKSRRCVGVSWVWGREIVCLWPPWRRRLEVFGRWFRRMRRRHLWRRRVRGRRDTTKRSRSILHRHHLRRVMIWMRCQKRQRVGLGHSRWSIFQMRRRKKGRLWRHSKVLRMR